MLDFNALEYSFAEDKDRYSFVGIQGNKLYLPLGFKPKEGDLENSFTKKQELFFLLYRTLRKFIGRLDTYHKDKFSSSDRDGVGEGSATRTFKVETEDGTEKVVYTRFSGLDDVLDGFDELRLFAMRARMRSSDEIDYSQISRYLDKATYLDDGTIYIDQMQVSKPTMTYHTTDLVRMYCFIYCEIQQALKDDDIGVEVLVEAETFRENHLSPTASLFDEFSYKCTRDELCDQLSRIDEQTAFKDDAYWHFYEAIEAVLYPQNRKEAEKGTYWGINNFCYVWEDMCQHKIEKVDPNGILYSDLSMTAAQSSPFIKKIEQECFNIKAGKNTVELKPDIVIKRRTWFLLNKQHFLSDFNGKWAINTEEKGKTTVHVNDSGHDDHGFRLSKSIYIEEPTPTNNSPRRISISIKITPSLSLGKEEPSEFPTKVRDEAICFSTINSGNTSGLFNTADEELAFLYKIGCLDVFFEIFTTVEEIFNSNVAMNSLFRIDWESKHSLNSKDTAIYIVNEHFDGLPYNKQVSIIDFKYRTADQITFEKDVCKQLVYQMAIENYPGELHVHNVFLLPGLEYSQTHESGDGIWRVTWSAEDTAKAYIDKRGDA